jgi:HEPN domain-containing protein
MSAIMNGEADRSGYWIERAEYDLETARAMLQTGRYLYVGFMCQQTVEKALKAVIAKSGVFPPKIHDLVRLAELANLSKILSDDQNHLLDELYPLSIEARYPSHKEMLAQTLNKHTCTEYITKTEAMLQWIKEKL